MKWSTANQPTLNSARLRWVGVVQRRLYSNHAPALPCRELQMPPGWIKLYRKLRDNKDWCNGKFDRGKAWVDLLLRANYRENEFQSRGITIDLKPGQCAYSIKTLAKAWGWTRKRTARVLEHWKTTHQMTHQTSNVTTIITILNWEQYQGDDSPNDSPEFQNDSPNDSPNDSRHKKDKKVKKERSNINTNQPSKRIKLNTDTYEWEGWEKEDVPPLQEAYPGVDHLAELKRMALWVKANPKKRTKKNWYNFALNWFNNAQERAGRGK